MGKEQSSSEKTPEDREQKEQIEVSSKDGEDEVEHNQPPKVRMKPKSSEGSEENKETKQGTGKLPQYLPRPEELEQPMYKRQRKITDYVKEIWSKAGEKTDQSEGRSDSKTVLKLRSGQTKGENESSEQRKIPDRQTQSEPKQHNPNEIEEGADGKEPQRKLPQILGDQ